jgi:hypothetical protein
MDGVSARWLHRTAVCSATTIVENLAGPQEAAAGYGQNRRTYGRRAMDEPIDYVKFSDECDRLAKKHPNQRDQRALLRMAEAWLLIAELAQLGEENGLKE